MSEIPFKKIESDRGKPVIVVEDQKFCQAFIKKNGEIRWRWTILLPTSIYVCVSRHSYKDSGNDIHKDQKYQLRSGQK